MTRIEPGGIVTVRFAGDGSERKLMLEYAPLEKIRRSSRIRWGSVDRVAYRVRKVRDLEEYRAAVGVIGHYFGWQPSSRRTERFSTMLPSDRLFAVFDGAQIVAGAGSFPLQLTVPGGTASLRRRHRRRRPAVTPPARPADPDDAGAAS